MNRLARFVGLALGAAVAVALIGYLPTRRLGGEGASAAMLLGCAVSFSASVVGMLPLLLAPPDLAAPDRTVRSLGSMVLRLGVLVMLGAAAALAGIVPLRPLILWIALSHLALLGVDTLYALRLAGGR